MKTHNTLKIFQNVNSQVSINKFLSEKKRAQYSEIKF